MYRAREEHDYKVQEAMPAIRDKIKAGDTRGAVVDMAALGIKPALMEWYIRTTLNPSLRLSKTQLEDFARYATPEERERMDRDVQYKPQN